MQLIAQGYWEEESFLIIMEMIMIYSMTRRICAWIAKNRIAAILIGVLSAALVVTSLLAVSPTAPAPKATQAAQPVSNPQSAGMQYVPQTDSYVVSGTVTSSEWHSAQGIVVTDSETNVAYTTFDFKADNGQTYAISANDKLYLAGQQLKLELGLEPTSTGNHYVLLRIAEGGM